jgi:hypothetical protein
MFFTPNQQQPGVIFPDLSLACLGLKTLQETLQMQLENRALMTFFAAIWLDTIALPENPEFRYAEISGPQIFTMISI